MYVSWSFIDTSIQLGFGLTLFFFYFVYFFFYIIIALTRFFPVRGYISFRVTITLDATEVLYIL